MLPNEEYNKLYGEATNGRFDSENATNYYCKEINGEICIIERIYDVDENDKEYIDAENIVAKFNADTPEGEIFSRLEDCCIFLFHPNDNGKSLNVTRNCFWCDKELGCANYTKVKYRVFDKIRFIDPIKFRDENILSTLEAWKNTISGFIKDPVQSEYIKIRKRNETIKQLHSQLVDVCKEWEYRQ